MVYDMVYGLGGGRGFTQCGLEPAVALKICFRSVGGLRKCPQHLPHCNHHHYLYYHVLVLSTPPHAFSQSTADSNPLRKLILQGFLIELYIVSEGGRGCERWQGEGRG